MMKVQTAAAAAARRRAAGVAAVIAAAAAAGGTALATTGKRADFALGFDTGKPGTKAALVLHVVYKAADDPDAKPSPIRKVVIAAPQGTHFDTKAVPACTASDDELRAEGSGACPRESRIGAGKLTADSGFGPPADPVKADLTLFNTGDAVLEVVTAEGTDRVLGTDRLKVDGSTLTGAPPITPGGPPDGETAVRQIDFTIERDTGFVTTPTSCAGEWISIGTFGFKDGAEETLRSSAPCTPPPARLQITPTRVRIGHPTRFTAQIKGAGAACTRGVVVRVGGRRAGTDKHGRTRLTVTAHRSGTHSATAKKRGCPTLRTGFVAVA